MQAEKRWRFGNYMQMIEEKLKDNDQYDLYHELELPLAAILAKMETTGVKTDRETLLTIGTELSAKLANLRQLFMKLQEKNSTLIHLNSLVSSFLRKSDLRQLKRRKLVIQLRQMCLRSLKVNMKLSAIY